MIHHGDCLDVMAAMEPESIDAIVTDPPYGLGFMGKHWDHGVPDADFWRAMLRVAKPSSYLLSFGGTRTVHRIATNIEDAGWIIRDMLVWGYASGFPKSKASLKPAWEPIVMARKPGPLRMLAIDECRIGTGEDKESVRFDDAVRGTYDAAGRSGPLAKVPLDTSVGRWPANIVLTDPIFDGGIEGVVGGGEQTSPAPYVRSTAVENWGVAEMHLPGDAAGDVQDGYGDSGTYSRFFLIPKAARSDREPVLGGLAGLPQQPHTATLRGEGGGLGGSVPERANVHPTVKPTDLMRHLVRLVTPAGGTVLDPFLGSGTTGLAAEMEGFAWVGIEREAEYVAIAEARLNGTQRGLAL